MFKYSWTHFVSRWRLHPSVVTVSLVVKTLNESNWKGFVPSCCDVLATKDFLGERGSGAAFESLKRFLVLSCVERAS